jgi:ABC-type Fe3+-hydroxamate transport system substrate-binding protein
MKIVLSLLILATISLSGCSPQVAAPSNIKNSRFPSVQGTSLKAEKVAIPEHYEGKNTLLLVGYVQRAQFDIDRWILGVLQANIEVEIVEVPTIAGMLPQMVQGFIDDGMRSGIPKSDWGSVVTVYEDASKIIAALGNERPQSAYAVLLDKQGRIVWSSNIGYSAAQILELKKLVDSMV